ncbi:MAG: ABC transporter ATP-binding protein [Woeseiaceae bacterium]|nr:ABC transporter ATP-binding protein [Woeseiaceae bacterium]
MDIALEARRLVKDYPGTRAVDAVSFAVQDGICFGLLGPNGAGKTTTIEIIEGVTEATSGEVFYRGEAAGRRFREEVGIQFQNTALQDHLTVRETLQMFQRLYDKKSNLDSIIDDCALGNLLDRDNRKLSGGQRQRLLLAVALVNEPRIVFLDEPTTGLDPQARRNFWDLVMRIRDRGTTMILTTHYMDEAQILCDEIAIMDRGKIIAQGAPDRLLRERYGRVIIELPIRDAGDFLNGFDYRRVEERGVIEIETDDVNASLAELASRRTPLQELRIREPNLEDLFLDLTGHELRA